MPLSEGDYYVFNAASGRRIIPRTGPPAAKSIIETPRRSDGLQAVPLCGRCDPLAASKNDVRNGEIKLVKEENGLYSLWSKSAPALHIASVTSSSLVLAFWSNGNDVEKWKIDLVNDGSRADPLCTLQHVGTGFRLRTDLDPCLLPSKSKPGTNGPGKHDIPQTGQSEAFCCGNLMGTEEAQRIKDSSERPDQSVWVFQLA